MTLGSLFAGIGGFELGLERAGFEVKWQVEIDEFCQKVLAKHWPNVRRYADVCDFHPDASHAVDCICGGFPCQDISVAGKGAGLAGERSGLFAELHRIVATVRPRWGIFENVPALRTRGYDRVASSLEALGYTCWPLVVGAEHVGAPHRRHRVWIVAHCDSNRLDGSIRHAGGLAEAECGVESEESKTRRASKDAAIGSSLADAEHAGRRQGRGVQGDEGRAGIRRGESAGGVQLADADLRGLGADGAAPRGRQDADERGAGLVHAAGPRLEGHRTDAGQSQVCQSRSAGASGVADAERVSVGRRTPEPGRQSSGRAFVGWPSRPGSPQHDWERPRLAQFGLDVAANGLPRRLAGFANRNGLRACGNAVVPACAYAIGRAIMQAEGLTRLRGEE